MLPTHRASSHDRFIRPMRAILMLALAWLAALALSGCSGSLEQPELGDAISDAMEDAAATDGAIDLAAFADPTWQRVALVRPYTSGEDVDRLLGATAPSAAHTAIESNDARVAIFLDDSNVAAWTVVPGLGGNDHAVHQLADAQFLVSGSPDTTGYRLRPTRQ